MKKELDSLILDCFGDDVEEILSDIPNVSHESTTQAPQPTKISPTSIQETPITPIEINNTQEKENIKQSTTRPRTLVYSHSHQKITIPGKHEFLFSFLSLPFLICIHLGFETANQTPKSPRNEYVHAFEGQVFMVVCSDSGQTQEQTEPSKKERSFTEPIPEKKVAPSPAPARVHASASSPASPISTLATSHSQASPSPVPLSPTSTASPNFGNARKSLFFDNVATKVLRAVIISTSTVNGPQGAYTVL
jgi:hypothetical protein